MSITTPFVTAICPTFRHPTLLASSLALWLSQDYPAERRELIILDDGQTFDVQDGPNWMLWSETHRRRSLPDKYNALLSYARPHADIFLVWEDDDTYLPGYVRWHVDAMQRTGAEFSKPSRVLSDYTGEIAEESRTNGRFHSSMAFTADLIRRIGGWPDTKRADFDQQLISRLKAEARGICDPAEGDGPLQYVYGWRTGAAHCQSTMRAPDDETWYERGAEAYKEVPFVGRLVPQYDERTLKILEQLGVAT